MELNNFKTPWGEVVSAYSRRETQDWNVLQSCLAEDEYLVNTIPYAKNGEWCIDIGAHIGGFSLAAASKGYNVIAVEPLPENADLIKKNAEVNGFTDKIKVFNNAISDESNKQLKIAYGDSSSEFGRIHKFIGNTLFDHNSKDNDRSISVETVSIDDLISDLDAVELFKIDCEGAEWNAFSTFSTYEKVKAFVAEVHPPGPFKDLRKSFMHYLDSSYIDMTNEYFGYQFGPEATGLVLFKKK